MSAPTDLQLRAPDPESLGKIRKIVRSAHKWGGNGRVPQFRKIRRVLLAKHPEVIAKAFGGNADVAAAWIKNNWYRQVRGTEPPPTRGRRRMSAEMAASLEGMEAPREWFDDAAELFLAAAPEESGELVWTTALRTGQWMVNPIPGAKGPLKIDRDFMEQVLEAYRDGAWEHVQVPTYHTDTDVLANTGFVRDLRIVPDPKRAGEFLLRTALEFTEPDIRQKVLRGSIAGVSVNVKFNVQHQESGKVYPTVLTHVALTNIPFINGLEAFKQRLAADKEAEPDDVLFSYVYEDEQDEVPDMGVMTQVSFANGDIWDESEDFNYVQQKIQAQLRKGYYLDNEGDLVDPTGRDTNGDQEDITDLTPAYVMVYGLSADKVLAKAMSASGADGGDYAWVGEANGALQGWVFGYEVDPDGNVVFDPIDEWTKVEKMWVELEREFALMDEVALRLFAPGKREKLAKKGLALPHGGFPIETVQDLKNAIRAIGRAKDRSKTIAYIKRRAKALGRTDLIPAGWSRPTAEGGLKLVLTPNGQEGGDKMADEKEEQTDEQAMTLTREDLDRIVDERAETKLTAFRQEAKEAEARRENELAATRRQLHVMDVREKVEALNRKGHAPAVVQRAKELMLADERRGEVLSLTRAVDGEQKEVKLSATDVVMEVLDAVPETALDVGNIEVPANSANGGGEKDDAKTRADKLYDELYGEGKEAVQFAE